MRGVTLLLALPPVSGAEQRSRARGKGAHVRAQGCASSRRPESGEQRRAPDEVRRQSRVPFLLVTSLWARKEK